MFRLFSVVILAVFAAGCGLKAQTYVLNKDRADIEDSGNAGFVAGSGEYQEPEKKTRKVYVLELSKPASESEVKKIRQETSTQTQESKTEEIPSSKSTPQEEGKPLRIAIPVIEDEQAANTADGKPVAEGPKEAMTYAVVKDDTLQKIAKKFYGSYGKWIMIYEANKDKIKNPNFVRPGTVLIIPAVE